MHFFNEDSYQSDEESLASDMVVDDLDLDSLETPKIKKKRIREKLDHLSHEEKLMRRKIKNRISAQSARDRKKNKMQILEKKIEILCQDRQKILKENAVLKHQNDQIIAENSDLKKRLSEIENRLSTMGTPQSLPVQVNATSSSNQISSSSSFPLQNIGNNNRVNQEANRLSSDFKFTSLQSAELVRESQQKNLDVDKRLEQRTFNSKMAKRVTNGVQNKELLILIKRLISLFMIMTTSVKTCSTGSRTATKICLQQTLKKLRQRLNSQQLKVLLSNVINRQLMMDSIKQNHKMKGGLGKSLYQKSI